jgi:hypothetical protein
MARAREEWETQGVALLGCGSIFAAIRFDGDLVRAAARELGAEDDADGLLRQALDGGAAFTDLRWDRYYTLVPPSVARDWPTNQPGTEALGRDHYVGIPELRRTHPAPRRSCYWCVPMASPGELCTVEDVRGIAVAGLRALAAEREQSAVASFTP